MTARFFVRSGLAHDLVGTAIELPDDVAHHAVRVVRLEAGEPLTLFDGTGGEYAATLIEVTKRCARARIESFQPAARESPLAVTLVQSVIATDAMDHAIRKCVELGVAAIAPVITARSAPLPPGDRSEKRRAHWEQIAIAACEQCGRNVVPPIAAPLPLRAFAPAAGETWFVCAPGQPGPATTHAYSACAVTVGPEGGFAPGELEEMFGRGAIPMGLGPRILRADTAAMVAVTLLQARCGDLR
ncbi:MAG: 16S rRNA (uracil(1498)-N(3))-methyltransferase [Pseudomonadota bacterium]|nr:16S rRNA (uracil(1498)-N(3))-methyltransferase [Pseudomonadota bacterium]